LIPAAPTDKKLVPVLAADWSDARDIFQAQGMVMLPFQKLLQPDAKVESVSERNATIYR
jgi:hypothetical protein